MKMLIVKQKIIVSILVVMMLMYGLQGIGYAQGKAPTVTPGENNTSLIISLSDFFEIREQKAHQVQLRRKSPQGEWITICTSKINNSKRICAFLLICDAAATLTLGAIFTDLEPGTTYEARFRDTNLSECIENPPSPEPWSTIGEGTTHLVAPPRVEFADANLAHQVRRALGLSTSGGHIDLLKIPQASLAKLTELDDVDDRGITDLTGLEHATQLTELDLSDNQITDITPLGSLTQLTELDLSDNQITDISSLAQLTRLTDLRIYGNPITDISPLRTIFPTVVVIEPDIQTEKHLSIYWEDGICQPTRTRYNHRRRK